MSKETFYLVDGSNYIYRAYYAIAPLSSSKGLPTNALYGFTQMILKLLREEKPDRIAVAFDRAEPTFRDEMFEDYKANRKAPPDDLVEQFPYFKTILEALSISVLELPGFEADDIIGTIAKRYSSDELQVVIVTGDKDLTQLIDDNISIFDSMKDRRIGARQVFEQFGVGPSQVVDVLGLAGDSSDNIPGVPGVGIATASKLIKEYGSVENLIERADELRESISLKITTNSKQALLSKKLVTIKIDVPIAYNYDDFKVSSPDKNKLHELFRELEFTKLLSLLAPQSTISKEGYRLITSEGELAKFVEEIKRAGQMSFDLETTSVNVMSAKIVGVAIAIAPANAVYIPVGHIEDARGKKQEARCKIQIPGLFDKVTEDYPGQLSLEMVLHKLRGVFEDQSIKKIGQNLKYNLTILKRYDVYVNGLYCDTMIASYLLNPGGQHNLDSLSQIYLDHKTTTYDDICGKGKNEITFAEVDVESAKDYACEDADIALRLAQIFIPKLEAEKLNKLFFEMEMPLLNVLVEMEMFGIKIDEEHLNKLSSHYDDKIKSLERKIYSEAKEEFNINSPRQLGAVLFDSLKLGTPKRTKTGYSTDVSVLEDLATKYLLPQLVLEYRSLTKLKSTYVDSLPLLVDKKTGRIHTSFNQAVAATGRLSSSDPNLQNIPIRTDEGRQIRRAFIAEKGCLLLSADYSQIELRVLAHLSHDSALIDAFENDLDVHKITAAGIFEIAVDEVTGEERSIGKTVNFATIYGQTPYGLSKQLKIDVADAKKYIETYFKKYPAVQALRDEVISNARKNKYVETLFGRKRFMPDINSKNEMVKQMSERMAFNTVFQGTAADIIKLAMIEISREGKERFRDAKMLVQVHDELLFEFNEGDEEEFGAFVKEKMEKVAKLDVPLIVEISVGKNWADAN